MQRYSVSVDDELAAWVEEQADQRGVSKAKVIRDAVATAKVTGLVDAGEEERLDGADLLERVEDLEARVRALESGATGDTTPTTASAERADTEGIRAAFEAQLDDQPPTTAHGQAAVIRVFNELLEDGPLETGELRQRLYPEFEEEFGSAKSMWQSINRYFDDIDGITKVDRGLWDADPSAVPTST